jgi:hypothetical protein
MARSQNAVNTTAACESAEAARVAWSSTPDDSPYFIEKKRRECQRAIFRPVR